MIAPTITELSLMIWMFMILNAQFLSYNIIWKIGVPETYLCIIIMTSKTLRHWSHLSYGNYQEIILPTTKTKFLNCLAMLFECCHEKEVWLRSFTSPRHSGFQVLMLIALVNEVNYKARNRKRREKDVFPPIYYWVSPEFRSEKIEIPMNLKYGK